MSSSTFGLEKPETASAKVTERESSAPRSTAAVTEPEARTLAPPPPAKVRPTAVPKPDPKSIAKKKNQAADSETPRADVKPGLEIGLLGQLNSITLALDDGDDITAGKSDEETGAAPAGKAFAALQPPKPPPALPKPQLPARRSAYAPDPVRQRATIDLLTRPENSRSVEPLTSRPPVQRSLPAAPEAPESQEAMAEDDLGVAAVAAALAPQPPADTEAPRRSAVDPKALSFAALVGVAVGLAGLGLATLIFPVEPDGPVVTADLEPIRQADLTGAPEAATLPDKDQSRLAVAPAPDGDANADPDGPRMAAAEVPVRSTSAAPDIPRQSSIAPPAQADAGAAVPPPEDTSSAPVGETDDMAPVEAPPSPPRIIATDRGLGSGRGPLLSYAPIQRPADPTARSIRSGNDGGDGAARNRGPGRASTTTDVNLRAAPDNAAAVVAVVAAGTAVSIKRCVYWCEVSVAGETGYIYRKFVGR